MAAWSNLAGTVTGFLRLGLTGVRLKNSAGELAVRNAGDTADAKIQIANGTAPNHAVSKAQLSWELISTLSVTAVVSIDYDLQEDVYCEWKFVFDGIIPATSAATINMRAGHTGGTLFVSTTSSYAASINSKSGVDTGFYKFDDIGTSAVVIGYMDSAANLAGIGTAAGHHGHAVVTIGGIGSTLNGALSYESKCGLVIAAGSPAYSFIYGGCNDGVIERLFDSVRFLPSAGSFEAAGTIKMFGLKRSS